MHAIEEVCKHGPRTRDIGGTGSTSEVGDAVAANV
jgi:tartrate dehydrogenase/decarboxylase/D-malate dehydrogenase